MNISIFKINLPINTKKCICRTWFAKIYKWAFAVDSLPNMQKIQFAKYNLAETYFAKNDLPRKFLPKMPDMGES